MKRAAALGLMSAALGLATQSWVPGHIQSLAKATRNLSKAEERAIDRCAELSTYVSAVAAKAHVDKAEARPSLRSSQSDGTPSRLRLRTRRSCARRGCSA